MDYLNYGNQVKEQPQKPQPQGFGQQKVQLTEHDFSFGDLSQQTTQPKAAPQTNEIKDELIQLFATPLLLCKCTIDYSREEKWCRNYD